MSKILAENLNFDYQYNGECFHALNNLNFAIEEGEFACFIGHSGCGKSTLLKVLAGLLKPTDGCVSIDGHKIIGPNTDRAVVFQDYSLFPWMTAKKNVVFGIRQADRKKTKSEAEIIAMDYLTKVDMADAADKYPSQLSGGMRQRVAIARALAMNADILLLDEPFGALDAKIRTELQDLMRKIQAGEKKKKTIFFITHDIDEAVLLGDQVYFMKKGNLIEKVEVPFSRFQKREEIYETESYRDLKASLMSLFYQE
ncbi:MAG: ABC transporter ATP-binding protein [Lachnospiraceae bacterium]|nr:ABC transporter ATP-binding protein [Lachnospiraceae bacterium]